MAKSHCRGKRCKVNGSSAYLPEDTVTFWSVGVENKREEKELEEVFEDGVIPESEGIVVPYLFIEADRTNIALQREEARRTEVKAGVAYEE